MSDDEMVSIPRWLLTRLAFPDEWIVEGEATPRLACSSDHEDLTRFLVDGDRSEPK